MGASQLENVKRFRGHDVWFTEAANQLFGPESASDMRYDRRPHRLFITLFTSLDLPLSLLAL